MSKKTEEIPKKKIEYVRAVHCKTEQCNWILIANEAGAMVSLYGRSSKNHMWTEILKIVPEPLWGPLQEWLESCSETFLLGSFADGERKDYLDVAASMLSNMGFNA